MGLNQMWHENRVALSAAAIVSGIPLTIISAASLIYSDGDTGMEQWSYDLVGTWAYWLVIPGIIFLIGGGYVIYNFYTMRKEFQELMASDTKAKFIKNMDRIEELAWRLHPKYEKLVLQRKEKYKVR